MKTLIELYDETPIENVMSTDVFRPEKVIFLCPPDIAHDLEAQKTLTDFLHKKNKELTIQFMETSPYRTDRIERHLQNIVNTNDDCGIDITGGTDNMLFAAGFVSSTSPIQVFTYSYKTNQYYNIVNAEFANGVSCTYLYSIEDFVEMAGGSVREGRVSKESLNSHFVDIDKLFRIFIKHKHKWPSICAWMQQASRSGSLEVHNVNYKQKNERGKQSPCPEECLRELNRAGLIYDLDIGEKVSFRFKDQQVKFWLRDVGSALETYIYKSAVESEAFDECACSVIVDWNGSDESMSVYNEIDVMAVRDVTPYFISCKACMVDTYALNELQILRKRFGGKNSGAILVTTEQCSYRTRSRADELEIRIIDINDIRSEHDLKVNF